ncbi:MAG: peptidase M23 [Bacteroidetes bacterium]|nr:peptidase M23 [Bacteroidota bacterium]
MKKSILALAAYTVFAGAILTGCNTPSQKVEAAQENVNQANDELAQANQEYLADVENYRIETAKRIAANDESIREFNAKIAHDKKAVREDYQKKMAVLEQKNRDMKAKMDNYKDDGKENWIIFKAEFNHDMEEMGKAFKDLTVKNVK